MKTETQSLIQDELTKLIELSGDKGDEVKALISSAIDKVEAHNIVPVEFEMKVEDVVDRYDGGPFEIIKTDKCICFRTKGGLRIFANKNLVSLYETINFVLMSCKGELNPEEYDGEIVNTMSTAVTQILELPLWVFGNQQMVLDIALLINNTMMSMYQKASGELNDDDNPELTEGLGNAMVAAENLGKIIDEFKKDTNAESKSES